MQTSRTAYGTSTTGSTPDGSNQQFPSATEINTRILAVDGEVATLIANTLGHPYQTTFVQTSSALPTGSIGGITLPARNGIVLRISGLNGAADLTFADTDVDTNTGNEWITLAPTQAIATGTKVRFATTPLPAPLALNTDYYLIQVTPTTYRVATTALNAFAGTYINLTDQGGHVSYTLSFQYIDAYKGKSADEVKEMIQYPQIFGYDPSDYFASNFWFIEGDILYATASYSKVIYTDYTLTSTPQSPEPYFFVIVAGTVAKLAKDGFDEGLCAYYERQYQTYLAQIASSAMVIPAFENYVYGVAA